ncbi:MAG: hypothetical protein CMM02_01730 [Rhodopirellula sp.]|nr:hypothetical protein [Rhodopirellula sp.]
MASAQVAMPTASGGRAARLFDTNLKYFGPARLEKLKESELLELRLMMRAACGLPPDEEVVTADSAGDKKKVVDELMDLKAKRGEGAAAALAAVQQVASQKQEASDDDEEEPPIPIFDLPPGISIIAFNIRKLRNMTSGTPAMWQQLMAEMATHDVVMLTEVPASEKLYQDRVVWFERTLNILSRTPTDDAPWTHVASEPSNVVSSALSDDDKPGDTDTGVCKAKINDQGRGNKEIHVCFVKKPVEIKKSWTWKVAQKEEKCQVLDWAPLTVALDVGFIRSMPAHTMILTMVHMPPYGRRRQRDAQLKAMLSSYAERSRDIYGFTMTEQGAKDSRTKERAVHVIAGDFNTYPGDTEREHPDGPEVQVYGLKSAGFAQPLIGLKSATSAGRNCYDNFLVDIESWDHFEKLDKDGSADVKHAVLPLSMPRTQGLKGISDHFPIRFEIRDRVLVS